MAVLKVKDILRTRYISLGNVSGLKSVLEKAKTDGATVDLCGLRLVPKAEQLLCYYYNSVKMIDSEDPKLDALLKHNCEAGHVKYPSFEVEVIPKNLTTVNDVIEYIKNVDLNKIYSLVGLEEVSPKQISIVILMLMKYPKIMVDLGSWAERVFSQIRLDWLACRESHNEYYVVSKTAIIRCEKMVGENGEEIFQYPGMRPMSEKDFVKKYTAIPTDFGSECLYGVTEYKTVWESAINNIMITSESQKTMKDFINLME